MSPDKLAHMANQIATFFQSQPHDEAVKGVAGHINELTPGIVGRITMPGVRGGRSGRPRAEDQAAGVTGSLVRTRKV